MNLDKNGFYGPRFIQVGNRGFNPEHVTHFFRNERGDVQVATSDGDAMWFEKTDAELVWEYLTDNSTELVNNPHADPLFAERAEYKIDHPQEELPY